MLERRDTNLLAIDPNCSPYRIGTDREVLR